jgi:hypothetical protein
MTPPKETIIYIIHKNYTTLIISDPEYMNLYKLNSLSKLTKEMEGQTMKV